MAENDEKRSVITKQPNTVPIINRDAIEMFESVSIRYGTVTITISDHEDGLLNGLTSEEAVLLCSDLLRQFSGEGSLEEQIDIPLALEETLKVNYGWGDVEYSAFVKTWRRNLYLLRIGQQNKSEVNLNEFHKLIEFMDKKNEDGLSVGDSSVTAAEMVNNTIETDDDAIKSM